MKYSLEQITSFIGAQCFGSQDKTIAWVLTDSRSLCFPEETLFFALKSQRNDGHRYIPELYLRGVRSFVVQTVPADWQTLFPEASFLKVQCSVKALQRLAERHRDSFNIPIIGITGSNGKTMVKEWLNQLLSASLTVTRSPRSYNSQIGVPLSVWHLNEQSQVGIFEAGISMPGEMEALKDVLQPTIGVFTTIGTAHQENFDSMEQKCAEKLILFRDAEVLVYRADQPVVTACLSNAELNCKLFAWSMQCADAPLYISNVEKGDVSTLITYRYEGSESSFRLPMVDDASIEDALHCLAVALYMKMDRELIASRMALLEPVAMRLEVREGIHGCTLINDSYNSDVNSLDIALDFMARRPEAEGHQRVLVLSDIYQTGLDSASLYQRVAQMVANRGVQLLIGIGSEIMSQQHVFTVPCECYATCQAFEESDTFSSLHNALILFKGARSFHFDVLEERFELKVHETTMEIDLGAIVSNFNYYKGFLKPGTKMVCMVKAAAYGAGYVEVAKTLQEHRVDYLAVATADEGVELRKAGIKANIIIMNPEMTAFRTMFEYKLEPEVYNFRLLKALAAEGQREGITHYPVHVKLDTGMCRLGFHPVDDMNQLIDVLKHQSALLPRSVFSHFVGSDDDGFDSFSRHQFALFDAGSKRLQQAFSHKILRHICNTAGIEHFPEYHMDMVRLGLGLYGINPRGNGVIHNVHTLKTTILQIREVSAGTSVGYSRRTILNHPARIAAIPIGYADGLNRHLGNGGGYCLVNGHKAPYVGNICMDVCMIDVTGIPCQEGDTVIIFGKELPVTVLSDALGTIPYEVLTSVGTRVKRVYFKED